ncbi:zinc ribbon domain-containing protein [Virgibacillus kimchii]
MDHYCRECGKPIKASQNYCNHCGAKTVTQKNPDGRRTATENSARKPFTKKQKVFISTSAIFFILLIGFYMWGNSYTSPEKTIERFVQALKNEDYNSIQETAFLHNGDSLSEAEAKAFTTLANDGNGYIDLTMNHPREFLANNELINIFEDGKWMGIFDRYSLSLQPQYIELYLPFPEVKSTFNGESVQAYEKEDLQVVYGPISPGIYNLESSYSGEFTEVETDQTVLLANPYSDWVTYDVDLTADYVTLELYDSYGVPIKEAYIEINDQKILFDENLTIAELGPLELDGSVSVTPTAETAWGKIEAANLDLTERYHEVRIDTLNDVLTDEISEQVLLYGEAYAEANAKYDESLFTNVTDDMRDLFKDNFQQYINWDEYFSGQFDYVEIDFDQLIFYNDTEVSVPAKFYFTSSIHRADEEGIPDERIDHCELELILDTEDNRWLIDACYPINSWYEDSFTPTRTLEGSQEFYDAMIDLSHEADMDGIVEELTINYVYHLVEAVNTNDYGKVEPYIKDGSDLHTMQSDLVERLSDAGMTQQVLSASVTSVEQADGKWFVSTEEEIKLIYESGEEEIVDYVWVYTAEEAGDNIVLTDIAD